MAKKVTKKKAREFGSFDINFLAGVDKPMQGDAQAVILKRRNPEDESEPEDIYKAYRLLSVVKGHTHMINDSDAEGHTSYSEIKVEEYSHSHPWVKNDDGSLSIGIVQSHTHEVIIKSNTNKEIEKMKDDDKKTEDQSEFVKKLEDTQVDLKKALKFGQMNDEQKAFHKNLAETQKEAFFNMPLPEMDVEIEKSKAADPVIYTGADGTVYKKSMDPAVVSMAKRLDAKDVENAEIQKRLKKQEYQKSISEHSNLAGEDDAKINLFKAIDTIEDDGERAKVLEILKSANDIIKKAFNTLGAENGDGAENSGAYDKIKKLANEKVKANDGMTFEKAFADVISTEEGKELYADYSNGK